MPVSLLMRESEKAEAVEKLRLFCSLLASKFY